MQAFGAGWWRQLPDLLAITDGLDVDTGSFGKFPGQQRRKSQVRDLDTNTVGLQL